MKLHLRLDLLLLAAAIIIAVAAITGIWLILLALIPVVAVGAVMWSADDKMITALARERLRRETLNRE